MIFTDLQAAIEEARYRRRETDSPFAVVQRHMGYMQVRTERWAIKEQMTVMYTTRHDRYHTVLPGIK
ncbi:conserved hypothetical protein [Xenorhabdus bovienii str. oregonense]|uniref:Uncharacterized protein n=1 Tax=Xenorhabdus bovienii str. oregonense TaxID=1398202 RepID=A0A077P6R3_XENBV|nr:hypothetical protein [Xenorhabdus bovienii]CDH06825.1 conserved hypothetical protein [Xenorhabdus bovienii str. oregonense]